MPRRIASRTVLAVVVLLAIVAVGWLLVDDQESPRSTIASPGSTAVEPSPAASPVADAGDYPGRTSSGEVLWGASLSGNGDPADLEASAGATLGLRRTFFQWDHRTDYLLRTATEDVEAGRVPWVSTKTPSWAAMAAGDHDDEIDELLRGLDDLDGPVWLTLHHEPEGGGGVNAPDDPGGPAAHLAMNERVRARMDALGTDNVALAGVFMAWTWDPRSERDIDEWWGPGTYDFLGVDDYANGDDGMLTENWYRVRTWAAEQGVDVSVAEWNLRGDEDTTRDRVTAFYDEAVGSAEDGRGARVVGLALFESERFEDTVLEGGRREAFEDLLAAPTSVTPG